MDLNLKNMSNQFTFQKNKNMDTNLNSQNASLRNKKANEELSNREIIEEKIEQKKDK